jgi:short-subunit dehydrogenase
MRFILKRLTGKLRVAQPCAGGNDMIQNPVVVITGATAGAGRATASEFARHGYYVALIARGREGLEETCSELERFGVKTLPLEADVCNADEIERAAERAESELGPIRVWVNSAMVTVFSPVAEMTSEEYREVLEITFLGYVHGTLAALKRMKLRNRGTIVQVGSMLAYRSIPLQSAYCAAKAAIRGFTDSLRSELIHDRSRVRLAMVQLPAHNTPQFDWARNKLDKRLQPLPPLHQPEVAARAIYRAAKKAPREYWLGRNTILAIVGNSFAPGILDRILAQQTRPDNLKHPVSGLHGRHGRIDETARSQAITVKQRTVAGMVLVLIGAGVIAATAGLICLAQSCFKKA